jgi:hypothetical protein
MRFKELAHNRIRHRLAQNFLPICALKEVFGNARKTACTSPMAQSLLVNPMFDHGSSRHFIP